MESKLKVHYCLVRQWHHHPLLGKIPVYVIFGTDSFGEKQRFSYPFYDRILASLLVRILNRNGVSLLHTEDVLHDLLSEAYMP